MQPATEQTKENKSTSDDNRCSERFNWSKATFALKVAKVSICGYISAEWEFFLLSWTTEELEHLPIFFKNVDAGLIKYGNKRWILQDPCPICQQIFENILWLQQNSTSKNIKWKPDGVQNIKFSGSKITKTNDYPETCEICSQQQCLFQAEREGFDLQNQDLSDLGVLALFQCHTPDALNNIAEYYWRIGKMFMYYGEETVMRNTSPAHADPALVFKMMKNCKLFDKQDVSMYDQVLEARNYLMHSSNQRIPNDDFALCMDGFINFLTAFENDSSTCVDGIQEIQMLRAATVTTELKEVSFIRRATQIQTEAVQYDLTIKGICGVSKYVLQGILTVNEIALTTGNWSEVGDPTKNTDIETIKEQDRALGLLGGAIAGAAIGTFQGLKHGARKGANAGGETAGPLGFLVGGLSGAVLGGIFGANKKQQQ